MNKKEGFNQKKSTYTRLTELLNLFSDLYSQEESIYRIKSNHKLEAVCSIKGTQDVSSNKIIPLIVYAPSMLKILIAMISDLNLELGKYEVPLQELLKEMNEEETLKEDFMKEREVEATNA